LVDSCVRKKTALIGRLLKWRWWAACHLYFAYWFCGGILYGDFSKVTFFEKYFTYS